MDESLSRTVIDFSGRPELVWKVELGLEKIGEMDTELLKKFLKHLPIMQNVIFIWKIFTEPIIITS